MAETRRIEYDELSEAARGFIQPDSPPGARMAAARGVFPLVTRDLAEVLVHLLDDPDPRIARRAERSLADLPLNLVDNVVSSQTHPAVLDFFARQEGAPDSLVERILYNRATGDDTFAWVAEHTKTPALLDAIAENQQRLLRTPRVAEALTANPRTPASTVARIRQFLGLQPAARKKTAEEPPEETDETPSAEEEAAAPQETATEADEETADAELTALDAVERIVDEDDILARVSMDDLEKEILQTERPFDPDFLLDPEQELSNEDKMSMANRIREMSVVDQMSVGLKGNIEARQILIKSSNKLVQECVLRNPRITIEEVIKIARDKSMREDLIRVVTANKEWTKNYQVRLNLAWNPKTPLTTSLKYLNMLNDRDLGSIAKSKQVPGMLAVAARRMYSNRQRFK